MCPNNSKPDILVDENARTKTFFCRQVFDGKVFGSLPEAVEEALKAEAEAGDATPPRKTPGGQSVSRTPRVKPGSTTREGTPRSVGRLRVKPLGEDTASSPRTGSARKTELRNTPVSTSNRNTPRSMSKIGN